MTGRRMRRRGCVGVQADAFLTATMQSHMNVVNVILVHPGALDEIKKVPKLPNIQKTLE